MASYNKLTPEIAAQLRAVVGERRFFVGEAVDPNYGHDEMPIYGKHLPEAAVDVETTEEVSEIMKICHANRIPVTCRGAGTGLVGGCVPLAGGLVLCTRRMNKILSYDMEDGKQDGVLKYDTFDYATFIVSPEGLIIESMRSRGSAMDDDFYATMWGQIWGEETWESWSEYEEAYKDSDGVIRH